MPTTECETIESPAAKGATGLSIMPANGELPFVTVIMPVRNEEQYIGRSLGAVLAQDYPSDRMEIIVADGQSNDTTAEIVRSMQADWPNLRLIDNAGRIVPTGMNAAIRLARGEIIVRVDGHCEVATDYVRRCVEHLESDGADGVGGPIETVGATFIAEAISAAMSSPVGVGGSAFRTVRDKSLWTETVPFPGYKRDAMTRAGLYDEELVRNQDDEYNYRLRGKGGRLLLAPDIRSRYYSRGSLKTLWRQYYQYGVWKVRVMQKHPRQMRWRQFAPAGLLMTFAACLAAVWATPLGALPLAALLAAYLSGLMAGAVWTASRSEWQYLPILPVAFAILHLSYGCGFLVGLIRFRGRWGDRIGKVPAWTAAGASPIIQPQSP